MKSITFFVAGKPMTAGSKRAYSIKKGGVYTGKTIVLDANARSKDWKTDVRQAAMREYSGPLLAGALRVELLFGLVRPRCHYRTGKNAHLLKPDAPHFPAKIPDVLKLTRGVEDALTGVIWQDDCQIVSEYLFKRWSDKPGVIVLITHETSALPTPPSNPHL